MIIQPYVIKTEARRRRRRKDLEDQLKGQNMELGMRRKDNSINRSFQSNGYK